MRRRLRPLGALASLSLPLALLVACPPGDGDVPGDGDGDGDGDDAGVGDGDGDGDGDLADGGLDLTRDPACDKGKWIVVVSGAVVDEAGDPLSGALFQVCARIQTGQLICLQPTPVDDQGTFEIVVPPNTRCMDSLTSRVFLPDGNRTTPYCPVDIEADVPEVVLPAPAVLHGTSPAVDLPALGDAEAVRTVVFPGNLEVDFAPAAYFSDRGPLSPDPSYNHLGAAVFDEPAAGDLCFLADSPPMYRVFGFAPEGDLDGRADLRLTEVPWPEGTEAPIYALGGLACSLGGGEYLEEGHWERIGTGVVDATGTLRAEGELGLPCFIWMGIGQPDLAGADAGN